MEIIKMINEKMGIKAIIQGVKKLLLSRMNNKILHTNRLKDVRKIANESFFLIYFED